MRSPIARWLRTKRPWTRLLRLILMGPSDVQEYMLFPVRSLSVCHLRSSSVLHSFCVPSASSPCSIRVSSMLHIRVPSTFHPCSICVESVFQSACHPWSTFGVDTRTEYRLGFILSKDGPMKVNLRPRRSARNSLQNSMRKKRICWNPSQH